MAQEAVRCDPEREHVAVPLPRRLEHDAVKASCCVSVGVKARKSCSPASSAGRARRAPPRRRGAATRASAAARTATWPARAPDAVAVRAARSPRSERRSPSARPRSRRRPRRRWEDAVQRVRGALERRPAVGLEARHLAERMHACVRAPRDGKPAPARVDGVERLPKLALDRAQPRLRRPAREPVPSYSSVSFSLTSADTSDIQCVSVCLR